MGAAGTSRSLVQRTDHLSRHRLQFLALGGRRDTEGKRLGFTLKMSG